jgi:hypothetical protein
MGSILTFLVAPTPALGHGADDRLPAGLDGDMLDPDHLLALTAMPVERVDQRRERAHEGSLPDPACALPGTPWRLGP